jgi:RHS repeat-associated protein
MNFHGKIAAIGLALSMSSASSATEQVTYYYTDQQGTTLATTDGGGNVISLADYRPYGSKILGATQDGPGYTSHVADQDSGLVYMQARYYSADTGRFLSSDPPGISGGDVFSFNRYAYTYNNPINHIDPDGRCPICAVVGAVAVGAGVGALVDYGAQKLINPGQPVNVNEVKVAAMVGGVSGGSGSVLFTAVRTGLISTSTAITVNAAIGGGAAAAGRIEQGKMDGKPATTSQVVSAGVGGAVGTAAANGIGAAMGDFSQAAAQGAAVKIAGAPINSPAGIGAHIVNATQSVGIGTAQTAGQVAVSQGSQVVTQQGVAAAQAKFDKDHQ